ncbi:hypothetical protein T11_11912 [Trichinella zimbabwensis]|uniref:DUF5641 domain-containing protein n=1 Tax=Trichinella zimbabwensis TaxID=268475 RepID=A0A0V1HKH2_9BILA|nr:hypothetical protein T11_11912 [Trichinella zimbabwensis]
MAVSATPDCPIIEKTKKKEYVITLKTWKMAQNSSKAQSGIIEIYPSEDGVVRSVTVKTEQGTVTRSARSLRLVEPSSDA